MAVLVFIDTNIYLDFYRARSDAPLSILKHVDNNHDYIITTSEVEMEYKKNRQKVILESLKSIKPKDSGELTIPAFLRESQLNVTIKGAQNRLSKQISKLSERIAKLLESPGRNDPVYIVLQRLFKSKGHCHLTRGHKLRSDIQEKANKRFMLGYPPRKKSDLSIGDALNWEWIIYCAKQSNADIVIVSRDSDYGEFYHNKSIPNDWLLQEFKERVSHRRSITLTTLLTEAFKLASITVSREEEEWEQSLINDLKAIEERLQSTDIDELKSLLDSIHIERGGTSST